MPTTTAKNEGAVDLSYKPPKSMKKITSVDEEATSTGFEWTTLTNDPEVDIWAVRVPAGFKPADLAGLKLKLPSNEDGEITGTLKTGTSSFALRTVGGRNTFGGEEMQNLQCLVPKKDDAGALYIAPKPLKHLILTPQDPTPTLSTSTLASQPSRRPQPTDRLKHSFAPIGATPLSPPLSSPAMELDQQAKVESPSPRKKHKKQVVEAEPVTPTPKQKKSKGKEKQKVDSMDVDTEETTEAKKPRKKPSNVNLASETSEVAEAGAKKGKKKRKAESEA